MQTRTYPIQLQSVLLLLMALLIPTTGAQGQDIGDLSPQLRERTELARREAAQGCLALNNEESMSLLLQVLGERNPHTRDILWEVLPRFTDKAARKKVELELRLNRDNDHVRQWCAELLGLYGDTTAGPTLKKALADPAIGVRRAAARSIGELAYEKASGSLKKCAANKDPYLKTNALEALARIDKVKYLPLVEKGLRDKSGEVRCGLLGAVVDLYPQRVVEWSTHAIKEDTDWRPRIQAVDNLAKIPTKVSIDWLIEAVADERPVVSQRAVATLQKFTEQNWTLQKQWQLWWSDSREDFEFSKGDEKFKVKKDNRYATYNNIQVVSNHVAFLIDKSEQMDERLSSGKRKDAATLEELDGTLSRLGDGFVYNVYTYAGDYKPFAKKPQKLTDKSKKAALNFVKRQSNQGRKDIFQVLEKVMEDPDIDTIYLLSSGEPEIGLYVHWNRVARYVSDINRFQKVVIHSVAYSDVKWYRDQLEKIAQATGGEFVFEE